jgi:methyl-accepting chemotaxis protein
VITAIIGSALIGTVGVISIIGINQMSNTVYTNNMLPLTPLNKIESNFLTIQVKLRDIALNPEKSDLSEFEVLNSDTLAQLKKYGQYVSSQKERDYLNQLANDLSRINTDVSALQSTFLYGDRTTGFALLYGEVAITSDRFEKTVDMLFVEKANQAAANNKTNTQMI